MRKLSESFLQTLQIGFLSGLTQRVIEDIDLDLEIRSNSINIYYKGNSLLKLDEIRPKRYRISIHPKFTGGVDFQELVDEETTHAFLQQIPLIKENIIKHGKSSLEIEYEQMIIRANNYEPRNNSEYFIVDRQYVAGQSRRFDLTGFNWPRDGRKWKQEVSVCLFEVKFALNQDIQDGHQQLMRYYDVIKDRAADIAYETEVVFKQKLELGFFNQSPARLEAMKTLSFAREIDKFQFVLVLVDYNPNSKLFSPDKLAQLPFAGQVRVFQGGFAMWSINMRPVVGDK